MFNSIFLNRFLDLIILIIFLAPIVFYDIRGMRIPDVFIIPAILLFIVKQIFERSVPIPLIFLQGIGGFTFFFFLYVLFKRKLGLGDAKLSALLAIVLGFKCWLIALFIASSSGLIYGILKMKLCAAKKDQKIPYAPFLSIGGIISFFLKDILLCMW